MKTKRFFLFSMLLCSVLLLVSACGNQKKSEADDDEEDEKTEEAYEKLREGAEQTNAHCPISLGVLGEINSVTFDDDVLLFSYEISEDHFNVATMAENRRAMKDNMKIMLSNPQGDTRELMQMVIDADCRLKVKMHGTATDAVASITLNAEELEELMNAEVTPHEKLTAAIASTQAQLPMVVEDGLTLTKLFQEGSNVIYVYKVNNSDFSISLFRSNLDQAKEGIISQIRSMGPIEREFIKLVANDDANLVYRYSTSDGYADVVITTDELKDLL